MPNCILKHEPTYVKYPPWNDETERRHRNRLQLNSTQTNPSLQSLPTFSFHRFCDLFSVLTHFHFPECSTIGEICHAKESSKRIYAD